MSLESIITLLLAGTIAGFIFSMPVAGPISITIVSRALEGRLRFCIRTALGAAVMEFFYVFIAVYGITALFSYYRPIVPYVLFLGALFIVLIGVKITRSSIDMKTFESAKVLTDKYKNRGGLRTGLLLNFTNPTLFFTWLTASFLILSFVVSVGGDTGGLDIVLTENINTVSEITGSEFQDLDELQQKNRTDPDAAPTVGDTSKMVLSSIFAFGVGLGGFIWFDRMARFIIRHREKVKVGILNRLIKVLGIVLFGIGGYLAYTALNILLS